MTRENESIDDVEKELAAEIAAINASNRSREDLVRELAVNRILLRYEEETTKARKKATSMCDELAQAARNGAVLLEEARQQNAELKNQQSKLASLLPKAFEAGKKSFAKAGANAIHAENRAMKQDVFAWLDTNMPNFKSMDSAAEAIAGKVAPVKFRAARDWVGEWKKLRSTGKA